MNMSANTYQELAMRTAGDTVNSLEDGLLTAALGLTGESGEFAELIKKWKYHNHPLDLNSAVKELGDICWYVARACRALNINMGDVLVENIEKLKQRYPDGFTTKDSLARLDVKQATGE